MKTIKTFFLMLAIIVSSMVILSFNSAEGQDGKIVPELKISGYKVIYLSYNFGAAPATVRVKKGTTVIWMNDDRSAAKIKFTGKQVTLACKSPVHFVVDEQGSFTSNVIPQGAVASLCFVEKGTFDFTVTREAPPTAPIEAPKEFKGKIIVE